MAQELTLDWAQFLALPQAALDADFHCVTQWSALDQSWEGVAVSTLLAAAGGALPGAAHIMAHCYGGYTANLPLPVAMSEGLLAHRQNGAELGKDHGWPLRLVAPSRYGWKSAKWVNGIEVLAEDAPGFWEQRGYHNNGDPWQEERFWPETDAVTTPAAFSFRTMACCQIAPSFLRKQEPMCIGGSTARLRQAMPAPTTVGMTKMRLMDTCRSSLTTRPGRGVNPVRRRRPELFRRAEIPACAGMTRGKPAPAGGCGSSSRRGRRGNGAVTADNAITTAIAIKITIAY